MQELSAESARQIVEIHDLEVNAPETNRLTPELIPAVGPVDEQHRISALDSLRGFALLGILLMNIVGMGMYGAAYDNPTVTGGATGPNLWAWTVMHIFAEGKMRCLFSMIFGASIILLTSRLEERRDGADIYYRRTFWLLLFGIVHAYCLWVGDILYPYALCALVLYPLRKLRPRTLLIVAGSILLVNSALHIKDGLSEREMVRNGMAAEQTAKQGKKLTKEQEEAKTKYEQWKKNLKPDQDTLKKDAEQWRSHNPLRVVGARAGVVLPILHSKPYYGPGNLDIWCMMFIGMALLKLGVLSGERSLRFYLVAILIGYGIGLPLNTYTAWLLIRSGFDPSLEELVRSVYDLGRLTVALGHLGVIMLLVKTGSLRWLTRSLAAVGQMAFSNYIFQSVVTAFLFTGYGFALYGKLQRYQLYYVVVAIWIFQLIVSPIWMRHYRFGPLEWCWRSLTYWKKQPLRRVALVV